jgi:hypothetical protein
MPASACTAVPAVRILFLSPDGRIVPATANYVQQPDGNYAPSYPRGRQLFQRLPNGAFAPVQ